MSRPHAGSDVSFQESSSCAVCSTALGKRKLNPRHHCRMCGNSVCAKCSPSQILMQDGMQRACTPCMSGVLTTSLLKDRLCILAANLQTIAGIKLSLDDSSLEDIVAKCEEAVTLAMKARTDKPLTLANPQKEGQSFEQLRNPMRHSRHSRPRAMSEDDCKYRSDSDFGLSDKQLHDFNWVANKLRAMSVSEEDWLQRDSDFGLSAEQLHNFNWTVHRIRSMTTASDVECKSHPDSDFGLSDEQLTDFHRIAEKPREMTGADANTSKLDWDFDITDEQLRNFKVVFNKLRVMASSSESREGCDSDLLLSEQQLRELFEKCFRKGSLLIESASSPLRNHDRTESLDSELKHVNSSNNELEGDHCGLEIESRKAHEHSRKLEAQVNELATSAEQWREEKQQLESRIADLRSNQDVAENAAEKRQYQAELEEKLQEAELRTEMPQEPRRQRKHVTIAACPADIRVLPVCPTIDRESGPSALALGKVRRMTTTSEMDCRLRGDSEFGLSDDQLHDFDWTVRNVRALSGFVDDGELDDGSDFGLSDEQLQDFNWIAHKLRSMTASEDVGGPHADSDFGLSDEQLDGFNKTAQAIGALTQEAAKQLDERAKHMDRALQSAREEGARMESRLAELEAKVLQERDEHDDFEASIAECISEHEAAERIAIDASEQIAQMQHVRLRQDEMIQLMRREQEAAEVHGGECMDLVECLRRELDVAESRAKMAEAALANDRSQRDQLVADIWSEFMSAQDLHRECRLAEARCSKQDELTATLHAKLDTAESRFEMAESALSIERSQSRELQLRIDHVQPSFEKQVETLQGKDELAHSKIRELESQFNERSHAWESEHKIKNLELDSMHVQSIALEAAVAREKHECDQLETKIVDLMSKNELGESELLEELLREHAIAEARFHDEELAHSKVKNLETRFGESQNARELDQKLKNGELDTMRARAVVLDASVSQEKKECDRLETNIIALISKNEVGECELLEELQKEYEIAESRCQEQELAHSKLKELESRFVESRHAWELDQKIKNGDLDSMKACAMALEATVAHEKHECDMLALNVSDLMSQNELGESELLEHLRMEHGVAEAHCHGEALALSKVSELESQLDESRRAWELEHKINSEELDSIKAHSIALEGRVAHEKSECDRLETIIVDLISQNELGDLEFMEALRMEDRVAEARCHDEEMAHSKVKELESRFVGSQNSLERHRERDFHSANEERKTMKEKIHALEANVAHEKSDRDRLEARIGDSTTNEELGCTLEELRCEHEVAAISCRTKDQRLVSLYKQMELVDIRAEVAEAALSNEQSDTTHLIGCIHELHSRLGSLQASIEKSAESTSEERFLAQEEIKTMKATAISMEESLADEKSEYDQLESRIADLRSKSDCEELMETLRCEQRERDERIVVLCKQMELADLRVEVAEATLSSEQSDIVYLADTIHELRLRLNSLHASHEKSKEPEVDPHRMSSECGALRADLIRAHEEMNSERECLEARIVDLTSKGETVEKLRCEHEAAEISCRELDGRRINLFKQMQLTDIRAEVAEAALSREELDSVHLASSIHELQSRLTTLQMASPAQPSQAQDNEQLVSDQHQLTQRLQEMRREQELHLEDLTSKLMFVEAEAQKGQSQTSESMETQRGLETSLSAGATQALESKIEGDEASHQMTLSDLELMRDKLVLAEVEAQKVEKEKCNLQATLAAQSFLRDIEMRNLVRVQHQLEASLAARACVHELVIGRAGVASQVMEERVDQLEEELQGRLPNSILFAPGAETTSFSAEGGSPVVLARTVSEGASQTCIGRNSRCAIM